MEMRKVPISLKTSLKALETICAVGGRFVMLDRLVFVIPGNNGELMFAVRVTDGFVFIRNTFPSRIDPMKYGIGYMTFEAFSNLVSYERVTEDQSSCVSLRSASGKGTHLEIASKMSAVDAELIGRETMVETMQGVVAELEKLCSTTGNLLRLNEQDLYSLACRSEVRLRFEDSSDPDEGIIKASMANQSTVDQILTAAGAKYVSARCDIVLKSQIISQLVMPNCKTHVDLLIGEAEYAIFVKRTNLMYIGFCDDK